MNSCLHAIVGSSSPPSSEYTYMYILLRSFLVPSHLSIAISPSMFARLFGNRAPAIMDYDDSSDELSDCADAMSSAMSLGGNVGGGNTSSAAAAAVGGGNTSSAAAAAVTTAVNQAMLHRSSSSAGGNSAGHNSGPPPSSTFTSPTTTLSYPHNFFDLQTGQGPKDITQALTLWPYRKHRPASGTVDQEPADGVKMMQEVTAMRNRLKSHVEATFFKDARRMAGIWNLKEPGINRTPNTTKDFIRALSALKRVEGSLDSERIVYMVCHHFHHQREWISHVVDCWCREEKITIEYPPQQKVVDGVRTRKIRGNRGGFGAFARRVKTDIVKQLMRNMMAQAGWSIATKDNSKQAKDNKYERIAIEIESTLTSHPCYVVTKEEDSAKKPSAKEKDPGSATMGSSAAHAIDVDNVIAGFGEVLERKFGVPADQLLEVWNQYKPQSRIEGFQIDTNIKTTGNISDLTVEDHARAAGFTMTTANPHAVSVSAAPAAATASNCGAPSDGAASLTLATTNRIPVSNNAAPSDGAASLTLATTNRIPVSNSGAPSDGAASLTLATTNRIPVSNSGAPSDGAASLASIQYTSRCTCL